MSLLQDNIAMLREVLNAGMFSKTHAPAVRHVLDAAEKMMAVLPIVEEAYWDYHTAFTLPGSGFNNKAQSLAGGTWNKDRFSSKEFTDWLKEVRGE